MEKLSRRDAIRGVLATGASVLIAGKNIEAQTETLPLAFAGKHQPKPLPFDPTKLNGISEKLIRSHHENNYTGAVKALNLVEQRFPRKDAIRGRGQHDQQIKFFGREHHWLPVDCDTARWLVDYQPAEVQLLIVGFVASGFRRSWQHRQPT